MGTRDSIIKGTALLTGAGLIVKILGAAYRIPLSRLIGAEGMGLYQMAYPVYLMFLSLSTAGLPIAISKIIAENFLSEDRYRIKQIFRAASILLFILGLTGTIGMVLAAPWLSRKIVADPRAVYAMWALAPAIFFMSMIAAFRGYFQGQQRMGPSAISQIFEQIVRVGVALVLVVLLMKYGIEHAAAGAAFGATAGGAAGLIFLIFVYYHSRQADKITKIEVLKKEGSLKAGTGYKKIDYRIGKKRENLFLIMKRLIKFALPISLAVILMPLLQIIDSIIVPAKLQSIGYSVKQATSLLGILGNSWAVVYLPLIVTAAISSNMVPAIAAAKAGNYKKLAIQKIQEGLRLSFFYLMPVAVMVFIFGKSIYRFIYGTIEVEILSWFAPAILFLGLEQVTAGILQGLGKPNIPLIHFTIGAIIKITVTMISTGLPGLNLAGAALGTVCGAGITASLNFLYIKRLNRVKVSSLPAACISGIILLFGGYYLVHLLKVDYFLEMFLVSLLGTIFYIGSLWLTGGITNKDIEMVKKYTRGIFVIKKIHHSSTIY